MRLPRRNEMREKAMREVILIKTKKATSRAEEEEGK